MYNNHFNALPDSRSSVSDKNECTFRATHWTFHFENVVKCARSNVYHFANVATTMFFQWAWVVIFKSNQSLLSCRKILIIMSVAYFFRCIGDCKRSTVMLIKSIKGANNVNYPLHIAFFIILMLLQFYTNLLSPSRLPKKWERGKVM